MGGKSESGVSGAGILKPLAGPGAGVVCFLVGSALSVVAVFYVSESEVAGGGEWASAARWATAALAGSVGAHHLHLLAVTSLLFLAAASVWRVGKHCDAVERFVRNADSTVQELRVGGVLCAVCGSKIQALKRGRLGSSPSKPVSRSLAAEFEQEAGKEEEDEEEEDNAGGEISDSEERSARWLRKRLKGEKMLKEVVLQELEKERRAAESAADAAMAKIAFLRGEKALVEREAQQFQEMAWQKHLYDRQVIEQLQQEIESFQSVIDRAVSEKSEDDRVSLTDRNPEHCSTQCSSHVIYTI